MAASKLALSIALACFLLAGLFLKGEAIGSRCKRHQVRERKPTLETLHWQEACLPLAVILGGCCGLVWWVLLVIYDVSQKGGQKGLPQISGEAELEEQKTTALDREEKWTQAGINLGYKAASKGDVTPQVEFGPCPPSQPKERGHVTFWSYLEQELERILVAVRCHRTTGQNPKDEEMRPLAVEKPSPLAMEKPSPLAVEKPSPLAVEKPSPLAVEKPSPLAVEKPSPLAVEKPSPLVGDWQRFLAYIKQYPLTIERQSSPPMDKQHPLPGEGPSSQNIDEQYLPPEERQSSPVKDKKRPPSGERRRSPAKERKKSPNRPRSRSRRKATPSPSSSSRRKCPCSKRK